MKAARGFTLIELLVVLAAVALLLGIAVPRYVAHVQRTKEVVLTNTLHGLRDAIDKFYADRGRYPASLDELASARYLRAVPVDPLTDSASGWVTVPPPPGEAGQVFDVHSGAAGMAADGRPYASW